MAKKKRARSKRAWAMITKAQAIRAGIDFGRVGCSLGLSPAELRKARRKVGKKR